MQLTNESEKMVPRRDLFIKDAPDTAPADQGEVPPRQLAPDPKKSPAWEPPPAVALPSR